MEKTNVSFAFKITDPASGDVLHETALRYARIDPEVVLEMEKILVAALEQLNAMGEQLTKKGKR